MTDTNPTNQTNQAAKSKSKTVTFFYGTQKMAANDLPFTKMTCTRESVVEEMTYLKSRGYIVTGVNPNPSNNEAVILAGNIRFADE